MRIDLPLCDLKTCRFCFDGNCTDIKRNEYCEYAELMNKRIQGLLIELPVPIGTDIWQIVEINDYKSIEHIIVEAKDIGTILVGWGIVFFASREKAEEKLKELKSNV